MLTLKLCQNRGKSRVWLDGASCRKLGIVHGAPYRATYHAEAGTIRLDFAPTGPERTRKVAGGITRPVVDLCSNAVGECLNGSATYRVVRAGNDVRISRGAV